MGLWGQISLLLWKNWLLQKRRMCVSVFEVLLPVAFGLIILGIRSLIETELYTNPTYYTNESVILNYTDFVDNATIGYAPKTNETDELMCNVRWLLENRTFGNHNFSVHGFPSESDSIEFFKVSSDQMRHVIVFPEVCLYDNLLPLNLTFTVRPYTGDSKWRTDFTYPFFQSGGPRDDSNLYRDRGVLYMQSLVGEAVARYWLSKQSSTNCTNGTVSDSTSFEVYTNRMAFPPYYNDPMIQILQTQLPMLLVLSFILSVIIGTKNLVYEKERKLKESMKLMGLTPAALWISWFLTFSIYLVPAIALYTLLMAVHIVSAGAVLVHTDAGLFFVFLLCYVCAVITFCFMVSTFVQKANVGAALSGILFFAFFVPYYFIQPRYEDLGKGPKLAGSLLFNCAMALGANCLGIYEGTGEGAKWSNFYYPATSDDNFSLLECMIMLLLDSVIHLLITWYLDNIRPGEFGVPKPFYFCFTKSYWCAGSKTSDDGFTNEKHQNKYFEKDPQNKVAGIRICNLKKKFGTKVAVAGTSLNMYEGQITVLLGHNGAGKTTTMSMLTGFIPPTSGTAFVNDYDIRDNIASVRSSLGLCPQHNILFDTLTVWEHLIFFAKLKGCSGPTMEAEAGDMIRKVGLETKMYTMSQFLSGGQKRKLSVGIALIGGSKVVILDEPTSGMDPAARRQTWNVLQEARRGRTVVLSTHYMDEADLLGDRIAIMAGGIVKCCGSSMFLKKLYGAGYHLVVVKNSDCNVNNLTHVIQSSVPTSELETVINTEITYLLPHNESSKFPALFNLLESNKTQLGIISFGTTATTMEEVFLKVGDNEYQEDEVTESSANSDDSSIKYIEATNNVTEDTGYINPSYDTEAAYIYPENAVSHGTFETGSSTTAKMEMTSNVDIMSFNKGFTKKTGLSLEISRFRALFTKKAIHTWRNRTVTLTQLLLPVIFTILGLAVDEARPQGTTEPPLTFDLSSFGETYIPYTDGIKASSNETTFKNLYGAYLNSSQIMEYVNMSEYDTFDNYTVKRANDLDTANFNKKVIIGMEVIAAQSVDSMAAVAFYNGQPYHSQPISVNYLMNTFLQYSTSNDSLSLQSSINPLPKDEKAEAESNILLNLGAGFSIGFFITFGMSFLTTLFIFFLVKERQVGAKHMQVVSGVGPVTYWLPTFLWDFINYIVPSLLLLVVFAAYSKTAYLDDGRWALVILVLVAYGWAVLPFMYAFQFAFTSPPTGVVVVIMLNIISGLVTTVAVFVLQIPGIHAGDAAKILDWIFMVVFPNYNMASCFINIYANYLNLKVCEPYQKSCPFITKSLPCCKSTCGSLCISFESDYISWNKPGIGAYLFFMTIQGAVCMVAVMLIEYHIFQKLWYRISGISSTVEPIGFDNTGHQMEDTDVALERQRINSSPASVLSAVDSLLLVNLHKKYNNFVAVDNICVGIPDQECFGLLGQNGAGKTTTFKMLTGDVMLTGGNAYLKGFDIKNNIKQVQVNMGYCPQFDALIDQMTGRETLTMYARLRGIPENRIKVVVNSVIDMLLLRPHADKLAGQYSGGNKRKLSTGMALIGDPPFIMLDEPSSGMDPKARRNLWNVLSQVRASGRTLVLTSHSMEECDALCTRIAIMVNGRFMCLGSPQHLKNKFGHGYTLTVQLGCLEDGSTAPNQPVINHIISRFPGAKVFDDHQGYVHFQVPDATIKLADIFSTMEKMKQTLHVQDYSVHQTTLEQIFLTFTRAQVSPKDDS